MRRENVDDVIADEVCVGETTADVMRGNPEAKSAKKRDATT